MTNEKLKNLTDHVRILIQSLGFDSIIEERVYEIKPGYTLEILRVCPVTLDGFKDFGFTIIENDTGENILYGKGVYVVEDDDEKVYIRIISYTPNEEIIQKFLEGG